MVKALKCEQCGAQIKGEPVVEEIEGKKHHFCCKGCAMSYKMITGIS
jgi:ribosome-binding protein aMBF1 (putative translation factor)